MKEKLHLKKLYTGYDEPFRNMVRHPLRYLKFMSSLCISKSYPSRFRY